MDVQTILEEVTNKISQRNNDIKESKEKLTQLEHSESICNRELNRAAIELDNAAYMDLQNHLNVIQTEKQMYYDRIRILSYSKGISSAEYEEIAQMLKEEMKAVDANAADKFIAHLQAAISIADKCAADYQKLSAAMLKISVLTGFERKAFSMRSACDEFIDDCDLRSNFRRPCYALQRILALVSSGKEEENA